MWLVFIVGGYISSQLYNSFAQTMAPLQRQTVTNIILFACMQSTAETLRSTISQQQTEKARLEEQCEALQQKLKVAHQVHQYIQGRSYTIEATASVKVSALSYHAIDVLKFSQCLGKKYTLAIHPNYI